MKRLVWSSLLAAMAMASPSFAQAADAWVINEVQLQAGPDPGYPVVADLAGGSNVSIQGCTEDGSWCDVIAGADRGWVPGDDLQTQYQDQSVLVPAYVTDIGIPVVTFSIVNYWDAYYRYCPFYVQRTYWYSRPFPRHWHGPIDVRPPHPIPGPIAIRPPHVLPLPHPIPGPVAYAPRPVVQHPVTGTVAQPERRVEPKESGRNGRGQSR